MVEKLNLNTMVRELEDGRTEEALVNDSTVDAYRAMGWRLAGEPAPEPEPPTDVKVDVDPVNESAGEPAPEPEFEE